MNVPTRTALIGAVIIAIALTLIVKETRRPESGGEPSTATSASVEAQDPAAQLPLLLDLGSNQCIPCKKMAPILEGLSNEFAGVFDVEVIDIRRNRAAGIEHGIRVIPTQIFFDAAGEERFRHEGFMSREAILTKWRELGVELEMKAGEM